MAFESSHIQLDGGVAEVSYRSQEWPGFPYNTHTATGAYMSLGDPVSGPYVSLNTVTPSDDDDWVATHYHGSDQFRVNLRGTCRHVSRHVMRPGDFAFQESGMVYREGVGGRDDDVWSFLVMGDRRGLLGIAPRGDNGSVKAEVSEEVMRAAEAAAEFNPGGPKGIPGVVTTVGTCRQGYLSGSFSDAEGEGRGWRALAPGVDGAAGAWGDATTGPVVLLLHAAPGSTALPRLATGTESLFLVVAGSSAVGASELERGDLRVTAADLPLHPVTAGAAGLDAVLLVADRRALPTIDGDGSWQAAIDALFGEVVPGGKPRVNAASA